MYAEVAWVLVSSGTQVQPQIILNPDYLPDYPSVSYDYGKTKIRDALLKTLQYIRNYKYKNTKVSVTRRGLFKVSNRNDKSMFLNVYKVS